MSGHSKWSTIKRQKGVADAQRGQLFTKLSKEIIIAAKPGGGDPARQLPAAPRRPEGQGEQHARRQHRARDQARRGGGDGATLDEITYEGYGPAGTAVIVEAATDNRNRTVAEVRNVFARAGGNLGETGSVAWNFDSRGVISVAPNGKDPDEVALHAIDAGAEDVQVGGDTIEVYTAPGDLEKVKKALEDNGVAVESAETARVPKTTVQLDEKNAIQMLRLVEKLESLDDVQKVYFNAEFSDDVFASYTG